MGQVINYKAGQSLWCFPRFGTICTILKTWKSTSEPRKPKVYWHDNDKYAGIFSEFTDNWNRVIWFSKNVITTLEVFHSKQKPHVIQYRSYKKFSNNVFVNVLRNTFFQFSFSWENCSFEKFKRTVDVTFKKHTPLKKVDRTRLP